MCLQQTSAIEGLTAKPSFCEGLKLWLKIGLLSFGGPAGQIALMHRLIVEEKKWLSEDRFLHALNFCMLLPGPEAQQLATYAGWALHRFWGGLAAGLLFILPGALIILGLSILYAGYHDVTAVQAVFYGIKAAVLAVVIDALLRIARRALKTRLLIGIAGAAFLALFVFQLPFPLIIAAALIFGYVGGRRYPQAFAIQQTSSPVAVKRPSLKQSLLTLSLGAAVWLVPVLLAAFWLGRDHVLVQEGEFFSKAAVVTFGGAYAVLTYVAQQAVDSYGWLSPGEMLDGLGLAETTPGPLILVTQFVGFLGAYRNPGGFEPMTAGLLGALITSWVTFAPCFLWIFLGAPYVEALRQKPALNAALAAVTAVVVGVILNLTIWFSVHVIFANVGFTELGPIRLIWPDWASLDLAALLLTIGALIAVLRLRWPMIPVLVASAVIGVLLY